LTVQTDRSTVNDMNRQSGLFVFVRRRFRFQSRELNQNNEYVQMSLCHLIVRCRPAFSGGTHG
jgi:hypothetical protein